jgi:hypothetical protein
MREIHRSQIQGGYFQQYKEEKSAHTGVCKDFSDDVLLKIDP